MYLQKAEVRKWQEACCHGIVKLEGEHGLREYQGLPCVKHSTKIGPPLPVQGHRAELAATLVEILVGVAVLGIAFTSLFGGLAMNAAHTRMAREEMRATQIMLERLEGIRLFTWDQLLSTNNLCPPTFTTSFYPLSSGTGTAGITYYGTVVIANPPLTASYTNQMRSVTVSVVWTNGGMSHQRTMTTYQAQYGMQNYVFNN